MDERLLTLDEAAAILGLSAQWTKALGRRPDGDPRQLKPVTRIGGRAIYASRDVARVQEWRAANPETRGRPRKQQEPDFGDCA